MTRKRAEHTLPRLGTVGHGFEDFCLFAGFGIRVAYPSVKALRPLSPSARSSRRGRIVIALTANPFYALKGIKPGTALSAAAQKLKFGKPIHVGLNDWYVVPGSPANGVLKVRHGLIYEIGIADKLVTTGRKAQIHFFVTVTAI
jgi:hypothetical protein